MRAMTTRAVTTTMASRAVTTRARSVRAVTTRARAMTVMASSSSSFPSSSSTRRRARAVARANDPSSSAAADDSDDSEDGSSEPNLSSSFAEELAKRRAAGAAASSAAREDAASSNPFERASDAKEKAPPRFSPDRSARRVADEGDQLARSRALQSEGASSRSFSLSRDVSRSLSLDADLEFSARQVSRDSPRARRNSSRSDSPLFSDSVPSSPPCPWSFVSRISSSEATSFTRATTGTDRRRSSRPRSCSANRRWIR